jgi:lysozyme
MKLSQNGLTLLKQLEGLKLSAYLDTNGIWTIGYGHTVDVKKGMVINEIQAETYLKSDVRQSENYVNMLVKKPLNQNQFDALVIFAYNIGGNGFKNSTLLKCLNEKTYDERIAFQMRRWVHDSNGNEVEGLKTRREKEIKLYYS